MFSFTTASHAKIGYLCEASGNYHSNLGPARGSVMCPLLGVCVLQTSGEDLFHEQTDFMKCSAFIFGCTWDGSASESSFQHFVGFSAKTLGPWLVVFSVTAFVSLPVSVL